ncbi:MAG: DUF4390 domain-containing protein [Rhodanobacter sp.]|nr:DUF4390 domain-containing protein [Rhodanobacter sp.]
MALLALTLAGCGFAQQQAAGELVVRSARVTNNGDTTRLALALDCRLSAPMQDALDHGIPITLRVDLHAGRWPQAQDTTQRVELRYFPLSRRYQLHVLDSTDVRTFVAPAYLIAALGDLRIGLPQAFATLPAATPLRVSVGLDPAALPGALRLPALFEPAWHLAGDYTWSVAAR